MTATQLTAIYFGLIGFAVLWPVVLVVTRRRPLVSGVVTLYVTLALAVVFLPLPGPDTPRPRQTIQLMPFQWVFDTARGDILAAKQVLLNVLLFVPLGIFVGVLARRTFRTTVLIGFAASLAIEITQLSGNFGIAPFVYRIFDVDDLMTNTTGAALGWIVANIVMTTLARKQQVKAVFDCPRFARAGLVAGSRSFPPRPTRPASAEPIIGAETCSAGGMPGVLRAVNDRRDQAGLRGRSPRNDRTVPGW